MILASDMNAEASDFVPPQFNYPEDRSKLVDYMKTHKNCCFIAKPECSAQGEGIIVFRDLKELENNGRSKNYVIQKYIDKPLLLNGYKFDLRIYVTVLRDAEGNFHAFVADEGLAKFCTEKYEKPTKDNFKKNANLSINNSSTIALAALY
jgi:hypothetical protein